jgi:hypothetical protein
MITSSILPKNNRHFRMLFQPTVEQFVTNYPDRPTSRFTVMVISSADLQTACTAET